MTQHILQKLHGVDMALDFGICGTDICTIWRDLSAVYRRDDVFRFSSHGGSVFYGATERFRVSIEK